MAIPLASTRCVPGKQHDNTVWKQCLLSQPLLVAKILAEAMDGDQSFTFKT